MGKKNDHDAAGAMFAALLGGGLGDKVETIGPFSIPRPAMKYDSMEQATAHVLNAFMNDISGYLNSLEDMIRIVNSTLQYKPETIAPALRTKLEKLVAHYEELQETAAAFRREVLSNGDVLFKGITKEFEDNLKELQKQWGLYKEGKHPRLVAAAAQLKVEEGRKKREKGKAA